MAHQLQWQDNRIQVQWRGEVADSDISRVAERIAADERFDELRWILHDFRECERLVFQPSNIEELAATSRVAYQGKPNLRRAVVTTREDVRAAFAVYATAGIIGTTMQLFDTMDGAQAWLRQQTSKRERA